MHDLIFATMAGTLGAARDAMLWATNFRSFYSLPAFTPFYEPDFLYRLFIHQAVLAGTIVAQSGYDERHELPHLANYPAHRHTAYPESRRAARLNDVITFRYDTLAGEPHWEKTIPIEEPLRSWLENQRERPHLTEPWIRD